MRDSDLALLRGQRLFSGLDDGSFALLAACADVVSHPAGAVLFHQGEPATAFFAVLQGWVTLHRDAADGSRCVIHLVAPGESFAEALVATDAGYPVGAETATPTRCARFDFIRFRSAVASNPILALSIIASTYGQLRGLVERIEIDAGWSPRRRVAGFLCRLCEGSDGPCRLELPIEQQLIAARLSMTPATFSRTLAQLSKIGVEAHRGKITVADPNRLARFSRGDDE